MGADRETIALLAIWASLLGAPPIMLGVYLSVRQRSRVQFWINRASTMLIALSAAAIALKISFSIPLANCAFVVGAYWGYCFLAVQCWRIKTKIVRFVVLVAAAAPIFFGYVLGTIGVLALGFLTFDAFGAPFKVETMGADLVCEHYWWGSAASASGFTVHLYRHWTPIPFVRKEVVRLSVCESGCLTEDGDASCSDALAAYTR